MRYLKEMRLLFRGGRLTKKDKWRNVAEHCVVQLAVAEVLSDLLQLTPEEKMRFCTAAAVHDWEKRLEKKKIDDPAAATLHAQQFLDVLAVDQRLIDATGLASMSAILKGEEPPFLEKLQWYLDDICGNRTIDGKTVSDILPLEERIAEVSARNPHPENEINEHGHSKYQELQGLLRERNTDYWTVELAFTKKVERELWERLGGKARGIAQPEDVPTFLQTELWNRVNAYAAVRGHKDKQE